MSESEDMESHLVSPAAFVEGGIQDASDDACSICLEAFCDSDPSAVTSCKHEFHLQCILEWCQRSSQCPMCWRPISLKDPTSQELLKGVEQERNIRSNRTRNTAIFHHPTLGDFELQHVPDGANEAELEEHIIQHLAAAAPSTRRAHHIARREGRGRSGAQGRTQLVVFSSHPNPNTSSITVSANFSESGGENEELSPVFAVSPSSPLTSVGLGEETRHQIQQINPTQADHVASLSPRAFIPTPNRHVISHNSLSPGQSTPVSQDRAGSSDLQSFSDSLKSRLNAVSMRYKESITKSTRGWKERLFSCSTSVADLGSEVRREVNAGILRMMERLDTRESRRTSSSSSPHNTEEHSVSEPSNEWITENHTHTLPDNSNTSASCAGISGQN